MTKQIDKEIKEFLKTIPNHPHPEREPKRYAYYVKLYGHIKSRK